eukprot:c33879_g1_i1 orf=3-152(-)
MKGNASQFRVLYVKNCTIVEARQERECKQDDSINILLEVTRGNRGHWMAE